MSACFEIFRALVSTTLYKHLFAWFNVLFAPVGLGRGVLDYAFVSNVGLDIVPGPTWLLPVRFKLSTQLNFSLTTNHY